MNIAFFHPFFASIFFALCLWCILFFALKKRKKNFSFLHILQKVFPSRKTYFLFLFFLGIISLFFALNLAFPYSQKGIETIKKDGIDIEIVLDVSQSMYEEDLFPSRIEAAKNALSSFISLLSSDRVGFVLYAGKAFQSVPLTFDYDFLQDFISGISPENINQNIPGLNGTNIGDALILAADSLEQANESQENLKTWEKIIILLTDGNANTWLDPSVAGKYAAEKNIKIYTIWIGKNTLWRNAYTPEIMQNISNLSQGKFYEAQNLQVFEQIFWDIASLEKTPIEYEEQTLYQPRLGFFLVFCSVFLLSFSYFIFFKPVKI